MSHPAVVGQWDFNAGDLAATVGQDLVSGAAPLMVPGPGYITLPVSTNGLKMTHRAAPNGGPSAARLNQWTLIVDLQLATSTSSPTSLIQIDTPDNTTVGDVFIGKNGIGADNIYHGSLEPTKCRVAIVVDTTQEQVMSKYINGVLVGKQAIRTFNATHSNGVYAYSADRWSLKDTALLFGDKDRNTGGLTIWSIQLRNYKMSDAEVAALGAFSLSGIPNDTANLSIEMTKGPGLATDAAGFQRINGTLLENQAKVSWNPRFQLQKSDRLGGSWSDVETTESPRFFETKGVNRQFFRLRSR